MDVSTRALAHRTLVISGCVLLVVVLALFAWKAMHALILVFVAGLVALLLSGLAGAIARRTPLGYKASLAVGGLAIVVVVVTLGWFVGSGLVAQLTGVADALPAGLERAERIVRGALHGVGADPGAVIPPVTEALPTARDVAQRALGILGTTAGALASTLLTLLLGVFLAVSPATYRQGALHLVPPAHRNRAREVMACVAQAVRQWLVARLLIMALTFGLTFAGLTLLGVPFALGLAVLSGLVVFVPYVGSYLSGTVVVLVALLDSPQTALYAALFYVALENIQGLTVEPLIEARMTAAPPALLLTAQIVLGALLGVAGLVLASPLVVAATVLVQTLYVEDALGDHRMRVLGSGEDA